MVQLSGFFLYPLSMKKKLLFLLLITITLFSLSAYTPLERESINIIDRSFIFPYNSTLDKSATIIDVALFLTPAVTAFSGEKRIATTAVMYAEAFVIGWGAKELLKHIVNRARPYLYTSNPPIDKEDDWNKSFPSGHTTMAFLTAGFVSYTFSKYNSESKWKLPLTISLYSIATATAVMRVLSGNHFPTDVLAGALLGTSIGILVPYLHTLGNNASMSVTPFSLLFKIDF